MFSHLLGKKDRVRSRIFDRSGQGTVEYVLLVALSVGIILGLMNQFYKPFNQYLQGYLGAGGYLECLIDVGELPNLGWSGDEGVCRLEPLRDANGNVIPGRNANTNDPTQDDPKDPAARSNVSSSSSSSPSGRRNARSSVQLGNPGGGADGAGAGADKVQKIPVEELGESNFFRVSRSTGYQVDSRGRRVQVIGVQGLLASERERIERESLRTKRVSSFEDSAPGKPKKMRVKPPTERKVASVEDSDGWNFGKFIRLALILFLIIAIILFLGGQALQISKGMDS